MPRARVPTRVLGCLIAMTVAAGVAATEKSVASKQVATTQQAPDEFGTQNYTVTTIGAGSFTPGSDDNSIYAPYYTPYSFRYSNTGDTHYYATVDIPSGALVDFVGLESGCYNGPAGTGVQLSLVDRFGAVTPIVGFSCSQHSPATDYNASPVGFQLVQNAHKMLVVDVETIGNGNPNPWGDFAWVEVWWKRAVSPPPATATFTDVPTSDPFFQYIEALAASGITAGCNQTPPKFCPDQPLTRGQMAVFLAKGLGLHWPD
jgi:hypothetical protein